MTTKYVVTDEQKEIFQDRRWELENRWRKGILNPEATLRGLQLLIEDKATGWCQGKADFSLDQLVSETGKYLARRFGKKISVDSVPVWFTQENLALAERFNLKPVFLPGEEIAKGRRLKDWIMPPDHFYKWIKDKKIAADSAVLKKGWYLADFSVGIDYVDGRQIFSDDPLAPTIKRLRQGERIDKYSQTPMGSRFAIVPKDEWPLVIAELVDNELKIRFYKEKRLERYIEFLVIGNLYDKNRGNFNTWEWFADSFVDSHRLCGGYRAFGGLAGVDCHLADNRIDIIAGRPLVSF